MIIDIFISQARAFKAKEDHKKPKKFEFMLEHLEKFDFVTSFLTKAEIMRELVAGHHEEQETVEKLWNDFIKAMNNPKYLARFEFDEKIIDIVAKTRMKLRTMFNFEHLFIAMSENAYFVSGDKDILKKIKESKIYDKVLSYIELRKLVSSLDSSDPSHTHQGP